MTEVNAPRAPVLFDKTTIAVGQWPGLWTLIDPVVPDTTHSSGVPQRMVTVNDAMAVVFLEALPELMR